MIRRLLLVVGVILILIAVKQINYALSVAHQQPMWMPLAPNDPGQCLFSKLDGTPTWRPCADGQP